MFEEMLAYELPVTFSDLLAADLDEDARRFYHRTAADIEEVSRAAGAGDGEALVLLLLDALIAAPALRADCWRRLYRQTVVLLAHCEGVACTPALARLRGFVRENADLAYVSLQ